MKNSNNLYKKVLWTLAIFIVVLVLIFLIPIIINEAYKNNCGYLTLWGAKDVLTYYSVILSGMITFIALFITLKHNQKITSKQITLALSQVKQPFFVIESIKHPNSPITFESDNHGNFYKFFTPKEDGSLCKVDSGEIIVNIKNIGDGIALSPTYDIMMFASNTDSCNTIIKADNTFEITYDFTKNLNDFFVKSLINQKLDSGKACFNSYIKVTYFNTMGVKYNQIITITIEKDFGNKGKIKLVFNEISPQRIDI